MVSVKEAWSTVEPTGSCRDLYSILNPTTWICRLAGIFPLTLEGPVGKRKYSMSCVLIIYSLTILVLTIIGLCGWTDHTNERNMKISEYPVVHIIIKFRLVSEIMAMVIMVATAILRKDKFANAIQSLTLQDISLRKLGNKLDYTAESKQHYIQLAIIILITVMLFSYDFTYQADFNVIYPLNWISWACPNIIRIVSACLFVDVILILKQRFGVLNDHLRKMIEETNSSLPAIISTPCKMCDRIRLIAMIHGALCEAALTFNQIFSWTIISGVIYALLTVTSCLYYSFQEFKAINSSYVQLFGNVSWGVISFGSTIYIVTACYFVQDQASLTGKLIHRIQISALDTPLNNVIQSFSLQLHHEKIEFSAAGFFPLNATFIQSIISAMTTYLIIVIQINP